MWRMDSGASQPEGRSWSGGIVADASLTFARWQQDKQAVAGVGVVF